MMEEDTFYDINDEREPEDFSGELEQLGINEEFDLDCLNRARQINSFFKGFGYD